MLLSRSLRTHLRVRFANSDQPPKIPMIPLPVVGRGINSVQFYG
nr:MAG TPA: hypothetical protein [Caudoviricetes sp.]